MNIRRYSNTKDIDTSNDKQPVYDKDNVPVMVNNKHYHSYPVKTQMINGKEKPIYTDNLEVDIDTTVTTEVPDSLSIEFLQSMVKEHKNLKIVDEIVYDLSSKYERTVTDDDTGVKTTFFRCYYKPHSDWTPFTSSLTLTPKPSK